MARDGRRLVGVLAGVGRLLEPLPGGDLPGQETYDRIASGDTAILILLSWSALLHIRRAPVGLCDLCRHVLLRADAQP